MKRATSGKTFFVLCAGMLAWAASAAGASLPDIPQAQAQPALQTSAQKHPAFKGEDVTRQKCIDALFYYLPGNTDYCHGIHEWANGQYDTALFDLRDAAGWANKNAQYALGLIYFNGHHVPRNRPLGLAWLLLSAERQKPQHYADAAISAYRLATPAERKQAMAWLQTLRPRYGDAFAAHRAKMHFRHAMQSSIDTWNGGDGTSLCITGLTPGGAPGHPKETTGKWRRDSHDVTGSCVSTRFVMNKMHRAEETYFKYLPEGQVDVGPVKQVSSPDDGR